MPGRPANSCNKTNYHWKVYEKDTEQTYCFMSLKDMRERYGINRGTAYLLAKNPETKARKYDNLTISKIKVHHHLIPEEQKVI